MGEKCSILEMIILTCLLHMKAEYLPFVLQDPFSTLLYFALCPRKFINVHFISGIPLASDCVQLMESSHTGGRKESEIMNLCKVSHKFSVLLD